MRFYCYTRSLASHGAIEVDAGEDVDSVDEFVATLEPFGWVYGVAAAAVPGTPGVHMAPAAVPVSEICLVQKKLEVA